MRSDAFLMRLHVLRALAVVTAGLLVVTALAGEAWSRSKPAELDVRQNTVNKEVDGWLHVMVDDAGEITAMLSEALAWRLEIVGRRLPGDREPYPQGYVLGIVPADEPAAASPCGAGEICPRGYSVSASAREVVLEELRLGETLAGTPVYRQAVTVVMPLDPRRVSFHPRLTAAVADACRAAWQDALASGRTAEELRRDSLTAQPGLGLKSAVFAYDALATANLDLLLRCWGSGFTRDELTAGVVPLHRF